MTWKKQYGWPHSEQVHWAGLTQIKAEQRLKLTPDFLSRCLGLNLRLAGMVAEGRNQALLEKTKYDVTLLHPQELEV